MVMENMQWTDLLKNKSSMRRRGYPRNRESEKELIKTEFLRKGIKGAWYSEGKGAQREKHLVRARANETWERA